MKCPYCGDEMIRGYLMSSRDITFAVDNPTKVFLLYHFIVPFSIQFSKGQSEDRPIYYTYTISLNTTYSAQCQILFIIPTHCI